MQAGRCILASLILWTVCVVHATAQERELRVFFDVPALSAESAVKRIAAQSGRAVLFRTENIADVRANAVTGHFTVREALESLFFETPLQGDLTEKGAIIVLRRQHREAEGTMNTTTLRKGMLASTAAFLFGAGANAQEVERIAGSENEETQTEERRDEIIVTGTNIRGIAPESSPVRSFSREDIFNTGAATAQDFIRTLPQNFGGGSNESSQGLPNSDTAAANVGEGSSVNLRGLGSGSTLVLLNGRRLAPTSSIGDFVDISLIPASAIERVDVLTDGASSIYGADAVAGVVNFVLRDDYDGAEASFRYGSVTQGDLGEMRASVTGGKSWNTGNALVAYEFFDRDNLSAGDRAFSQASPLPTDLLPAQDRHSVLASVSQEATSRLDLSADFSFSRKTTERDVATTAVSSDFASETRTFNASAGASWNIAGDWFLDIAAGYNRVDVSQLLVDADNIELDSEIFSSDIIASGGVFSLPGGEVKLALGGHFRTEDFISTFVRFDRVLNTEERDVYAAFGELFVPIVGPENRLPGVERFEVNVSARYSDFSDFGDTLNPKVGVLWSPVDSLRLRGSYSTSFNPPALGRVGAIDFSAFVFRTADLNPALGQAPGDPSIADVIGLSVNGTSNVLAPEKSRTFTTGVDFNQAWGRHDVSASITYFDTRFEDRIGLIPIPGNRLSFEAPNIAIRTPEAFPEGAVVFDPPAELISAILAEIERPLTTFRDRDLDPFDAAFVNFTAVTQNLATSIVRGIDFELNYALTSDHGVYSTGVSGTYLDDFQQQASDASARVELLNTQFNPVDLKLRWRLSYAREGFAAVLFVNYTDAYRVDNTPGAAPIDAWTTVDLNFVYDTAERFDSRILNDVALRLSVNNLFDEDPPEALSFPLFRLFGYDPTNASPLNRFISFEITKRF